MAETVQKVRVFISSPGDVQEERSRLSKVFEELNSTVAAEKGLVLEPVRWETHARTEIGDSPQEAINRQKLGQDCDVFLGIMWQRFGTPTKEADSGTEEEFLYAYARWEEDRRRHILFYFCERPPAKWPPDDVEQIAKIKSFREELETKGLVGTYVSLEDFTDRVRRDLTRLISDWSEDETEPIAAPTRFTVFLADVDGSLKLLQHSLAKKLEKEGVGVMRRNGDPVGEDWERQAIAQAHASIHLLGETAHAGTQQQLDLALESGRRPVIWVSSDLDLGGPAAAANPFLERVAALDRRETDAREYDFIRERPLRAAKVILERVSKLRETWRQSTANRVLFNVHANDTEFAWDLVSRFEDQIGLKADVYGLDEGLDDAPGMKAFEEKLARCNAVVFVFGKAEPEWISHLMSQAMLKVLATGYSIDSWGVALAPPPVHEIGEEQFGLACRLTKPLRWIDMQSVDPDDDEAFSDGVERLRDLLNGSAAAESA
jgi:hypothetical protein